MRIAGINSPDYQRIQQHQNKSGDSKSNDAKSSGLNAASINSTNQGGSANIVPYSHEQRRHPTSAVPENQLQSQSIPRTQFYSAIESTTGQYAITPGTAAVVKATLGNSANINVYHPSQANWSAHNLTAPDNTALKARLAISEYLDTQYVEERSQFAAALGVDEYA